MGVYVKDMTMPNNCMECMKSGLRSAIKCEEWKYLSAGLFESRRVNTCPLVEVPEKHGRLIDADELTTDNIVSKIMIFGGQVCYSQSDIDNAPTVIEAEGE